MGILINDIDFVGKYAIAQNSFSKLSAFIEQFEKQYLYDLLGKTLADSFITSVINYVPVGVTFLNIYNEIDIDSNRNEGMKKMLLGFIYFEYLRKQPLPNTITGTVSSSNENSKLNYDAFGLINIYNSSVNDYAIIQYYINQNSNDYTNYKGSDKGYSEPF